jgi:hypothetical protein
MGDRVVSEVPSAQQLGLDHVIEAELTNGHHDGTTGCPVGAAEELFETFLSPDL